MLEPPDAEDGSTVDERTRLMEAPRPKIARRASEERPQESNLNGGDEVPLPWGQIFLLCYARLVDPIAYFCIFPFINQMILENGNIEETDVGFWSGLIVGFIWKQHYAALLTNCQQESLFSLTQMGVMILWGRAADRVGRKPVLVFSLAGLAVAISLFGVSKTIWQMIVFRCFAGLFAGTIV